MNVGPLALPLEPLIFLFSVAISLAVAQVLRRRDSTLQQVVFTSVWVGLIVARIAFVLRFFPDFEGNLLSVFDIRDRGFDAIAGVIAGSCVAARAFIRAPMLRQPLVLALSSGVLAWGVAQAAVEFGKPAQTIPSIALADLNGGAQPLSQRDGRPTVVNLWASWCGPCAAEIPVLAQAQADQSGMRLVFVNQGEAPAQIRQYLDGHDLSIQHALLDPAHEVAKIVGAVGFPTTLFYDSDGRLLATHLGPFSKATFNEALRRFYPHAYLESTQSSPPHELPYQSIEWSFSSLPRVASLKPQSTPTAPGGLRR